jgi:hypothetical protein
MVTNRTSTSPGARRIHTIALLALLALSTTASAQEGNGPDRPACSTTACQKIKTYVKAHYCGDSPIGNGPDDGCDIKLPKLPRKGVEVLADYRCGRTAPEQAWVCTQIAQPSALVRTILSSEMRRLGLPANATGQTLFYILKSTVSGVTVASAKYSRVVGENEELCDVIVTIDQSSRVTVLRELRFQKTDVEVPNVTEWLPIDLADVNGDGQVDVVLEGDAYEDHWIEVVSYHNGSPETVFSGLGYYL